MNDLKKLQKEIRQFARERDWVQFHSAKNLSMALNVEAAELLECFQWLTEEQSNNLSPTSLAAASEEVADIFVYLLTMANTLNIDLIAATKAKIAKNAIKYPIEKSKGNALKYDKL